MLPPFFCTGIAPHLHGSIGDTEGVIFPTRQFFSEVHSDFTDTGGSGGGCNGEGSQRP